MKTSEQHGAETMKNENLGHCYLCSEPVYLLGHAAGVNGELRECDNRPQHYRCLRTDPNEPKWLPTDEMVRSAMVRRETR